MSADVRQAQVWTAYCAACHWESEQVYSEDAADLLADEHDADEHEARR